MRTRIPLKATAERTKRRPKTPPARTELCQKILEDFQVLGIPLRTEQLDPVLGRAESEGLSHLEFLRAVISEQANGRRERRIVHRIREAGFGESKTLVDFDWQFNAATIDRVRIETLAGGEFISRQQNLLWVGQSGVGKSHLIKAIGLCAGLSSAV
jgi:DNA replication protein DnaC